MSDYYARQDEQIKAVLRAHYAEMAANGQKLDPVSAAYNRAAWPDVIPPPEIEPEPEPEPEPEAG